MDEGIVTLTSFWSRVPVPSVVVVVVKSCSLVVVVLFYISCNSYNSVTFSDSRWNSGENKVQTQMVFADWFLPRDFYAGVGIANSSLATLGASDSSIKPVITFGKSRRLSQRFAIEIGFCTSR